MSDIGVDETLVETLRAYADGLKRGFESKGRYQPEDQLKPPVSTLLQAAGSLFGLEVRTHTEILADDGLGRPDIGVFTSGLLTGHVELKAPEKPADPTRLRGGDRQQWERFKGLPNLLYCNGREFVLMRSGERVASATIGEDPITEGANAVSAPAAAKLTAVLREFLRWEPIAPSSPKQLAATLAPLCRLLRGAVLTAVKAENEELTALAKDWRRYLFPSASDEEFADAYAQTLTYALLLARIEGDTAFSIDAAAKSLATGHSLLASALKILSDEQARQHLAIPFSYLERTISAVDPAQLMKKSKGDPWLYFYEDFLAAYDPEMRKNRGVYYTPIEVVHCQVRLVAELLRDRFDADRDFTDPQVITLDPAVGTGTYLLAALEHSLDAVEARSGTGARRSAASTAAKNLHGFELLVGPYAVAHLRLTQMIHAENAKPGSDGVRVYLTDTLESPHKEPPEHLPLLYKELGEEHERARRVKESTPVMVCIGNPPYDREQRAQNAAAGPRKGGWVRFGDGGDDSRPLLQDFIEPLSDLGYGVHAKNLYNDYVYFWRWALWKVFEQQGGAGKGIVSFITASSYLLGHAFAGVRATMRSTFEEMWILDLGGEGRGARKSENVFAIQTPVCIAIGVRRGPTDGACKVWYHAIDGSTAEKLAALESIRSLADVPWIAVTANEPHEPMLPSTGGAWNTWPRLTDLFPWQESGLQFKRTWPIAADVGTLDVRWRTLLASSSRALVFKETRDLKISKEVAPLIAGSPKLTPLGLLTPDEPMPSSQPYAYRSFDIRSAIIDPRVGDYLRPSLQHCHSERQVYLATKFTLQLGTGGAASATCYLPDLDYFNARGGRDIVPLYRDRDGREPNIATGILALLTARLGQSVSAEDFFAYCYAMLAGPAYAETFADELSIPGPRIPLTTNPRLFDEAVALGREWLFLHTYGERFVPTSRRAGRIPAGAIKCAKGTSDDPAEYPESFSYDAAKRELRVGDGRFTGVSPEVYEFQVSGYKVVQRWLAGRMKERSGKRSSPLDDIRPERWTFDNELLQLLWVLEHSCAKFATHAALLVRILGSKLISADELAEPTFEDRAGPRPSRRGNTVQETLNL
ncbi:N-6 DNA methylase [Pseudogemmatithrix spongiicola]|uniref:site-specific DNA-methyltransferase (adenine-specific) n=1 Tax=Pseudogemmatithrix spongiicola TaxID=3062599 RepID=A0AA49Q745_9BACT|nr:N-6 DNA methylase [Gemmatimonadaceae bacterium 'strain 138']WKW14396.1 N-6 DNA methylase [Gemmatimonadaceae bacterium 'strain 318']